ncbi:MAG: ThuA domain-containing protein [Limisphaerales bacterium]
MNLPHLAALLLVSLAAAAEPVAWHTRSWARDAADTNLWRRVEREASWKPEETAVIICDMWDRHWCAGATARVAEMAPRMNAFLQEARRRGMVIIHAPSDTMDFYAAAPQRRRAQAVEKVALPEAINEWKSLNAAKEPPLPIDDSDGGCDDEPPCQQGRAWTSQIAVLGLGPDDYLSDRGDEIYSILRKHGIRHVVILGVHTNMCVLGRPFSIRQMVSLKFDTVLVRDLTDTMYNSRRRPFVSHFVGTDLVVEHIERHWCPSVTSTDLLGGEPFRFAADRRKRVAFLVGEDEYRTWETLPAFAAAELAWRGYELRWVTAPPGGGNDFTNADALRDADLVVVSVRRRAPAQALLEALRAHLAAGRPVVGLRTASHAFAPRGDVPAGHAAWPEFDQEVLGARYEGHFSNRSGEGDATRVRPAAGAEAHPVLAGVGGGFLSAATLYRSRALAPTATPLLVGACAAGEEPVAWVNTAGGRRTFYTSLGGPEDFAEPAFRRLLLNGVLWALGDRVPPG